MRRSDPRAAGDSAAYQRAFEKMEAEDPAALDAFEQLIAHDPEDGLAAFHLGTAASAANRAPTWCSRRSEQQAGASLSER